MSSPLTATYRLQLTPDFTFADAANLVPYLQSLGISHLYLSPVFEAVPGSVHGYDVTDPTSFRSEFGGEPGFRSLADAAADAGLGTILDIVPNHMAVSHHNPWWYDVMKFGQGSEFAQFFDINWDADSEGKLVLPTLGRTLEEVVEAGELELSESSAGLEFFYFDKRFPVSLETEQEARQLAGRPDTRSLLQIAERQHYRLMFWRDGLEQLNYRRFFDIADLVCLHAENLEVFEQTHSLLAREVDAGRVSGVRVDHVDGLADPGAYLKQLNSLLNLPDHERQVPIYVEKILAPDEEMPMDWPVAGATGYEFASQVTGLFVDPDGLSILHKSYSELTGERRTWQKVEHTSRLYVIDSLFQPELDRLSDMLQTLVDEAVSRQAGASAIRAVTARMNAYRTYRAQPEGIAQLNQEFSEARIELATMPEALLALDGFESIVRDDAEDIVTEAGKEFVARWRQFSGAVAGKGVEDTAFYRYAPLAALNEVGGDPSGESSTVESFHRLNLRNAESSPLTMNATSTHDTKRSEDTRCRMVTLSEFAGEWDSLVPRWIEMNARHVATNGGVRSPSKRAEVLFYQSLAGLWPVEPTEAELRDIANRLSDYMVKAEREAKVETNWHEPDSNYEDALRAFVGSVLSTKDGEAFRRSFDPFAQRVAFHGAVNSLSQLLLKAASPGVPDFYQGAELWDFSLVDPDNRRPVDFFHLEEQMQALTDESPPTPLFEKWQSDAIKHWLTFCLLQARKNHSDLFAYGDYEPLEANGPRAGNCVGFMRSFGDSNVVALATRLSSQLGGAPAEVIGDVWNGTSVDLPSPASEAWTNALTGAQTVSVDGKLELSEAFGRLPVALLVSHPAQGKDQP